MSGGSTRELRPAGAAVGDPVADVSGPAGGSSAEPTGAASYRAALKPTAITGSSTLVVLALQLVKSKVIAVLLGPGGIGLFALLSSAVGLITKLVGLGINSSGVRQVAAAVATGDRTRIARVIFTLRRTSVVLGLTGAVVVIAFREPLARLLTGTSAHATALGILGVVILFRTVNGGQNALLRGVRQIGNLARLRMWGALCGTALAIPMVWLWGMDGIAPAIVAVASLTMLASWWYARRVRIPRVRLTFTELRGEISGMLGLGLAFLVSGVFASLAGLGTRTILSRDLGLDALGQFQAAVALSVVYVDFILRAMGLDFLPRLTGVAHDNAACNRLVNEQSEISMLLAGPGVLSIVILAPIVIPILYSGGFDESAMILRWQCLGVLLRIATWPVGYVLQAKKLSKTFATLQMFAHSFYVLAFWLLTQAAGLAGAALALAALYAVHLPAVVMLVQHHSGFSWTPAARQVLLVVFGAYTVCMVITHLLPTVWAVPLGLLIVAVVAAYSYRGLCRRVEVPLAQTALKKLHWVAGQLARATRSPSSRPDSDGS